MRIAIDNLISRLNTDKERINELEDRSIEIIQTEIQKEKKSEKKINRTHHSRSDGQ